MLRQSCRSFHGSATINAATASKAFSKKGGAYQPRKKRLTPNCLYKPFEQTASTSKFNLKAPKLDNEVFVPQDVKKSINTVTEYGSEHLKALYNMGTFKQGQHNELFRSPISLIRETSTLEFLEKLKKHSKFVITGEQGIGKTTLLAQTQSALSDTHIVIHVSHPAMFLNGQTDFHFDQSLNEYTNPMFIQDLFRKVLRCNEKMLKNIKLSNTHKFQVLDVKNGSKSIKTFEKEKNSLYDLISIKTSSESKGKLFQQFIHELQHQKEYPVAFTMDNFSRLVTTSYTSYRDTEAHHIPTLKFQLPRMIFDIISGDISFAHKNSKVVLAVTGGHRSNKTLPTALGTYERNPYLSLYQYNEEFAAKMKKGGLQAFEVPRLSSNEVSILLDYYKKAGVSNQDHSAKEEYFVSGNGNPLALIKSITMNFY